MTTMTEYVESHGITVEILKDKGFQTDEDNWEHHAYQLRVHFDGRTIDTRWMQGTGITESPVDRPDMVFDSLISDASTESDTFEDFCGEFGYDTDSRRAYATWELLNALRPKVIEFVGGVDEFEHIAYQIERL